MTDLRWTWMRNGRNGYYGYTIDVPDAGKQSVDACMELSTRLDKIINTEIEDRKKIKADLEAQKKLTKKRAKA